MSNQSDSNARPAPDSELVKIADYVRDYAISSDALNAASLCLMDSISCALMALSYPACTRHLGPIVPGATLKDGARVIGTKHQLDPVKAAFDNGALIRWLDFNDTWLAAEWGHPSDNLGAIWAVTDYLSRQLPSKNSSFCVRDVLEMMIKAHEIQGVLALENSLNRVGLDHVAYVKLASTAVCTQLWGGTKEQIISAISHALADGQSLRTYRHAPNTGSRKSWAAGDAASRGVRLAMLALKGESVIPTVLSAKTWGFYDVLFGGNTFRFQREFGSYVMENILFKVSFPAEFHAQTAVECAITLHPHIINKLDKIEKICIETQESAVRIISKTGPLYNPADRDHCLQYMVATGLLFGNLTAAHYEQETANDERIDALREKMKVVENPRYTADYLDPEKRSIANAIQIFFNDGSNIDRIEVEYPLGHRRRREESLPHIEAKFYNALKEVFDDGREDNIMALFVNRDNLMNMPFHQFSDLFAKNSDEISNAQSRQSPQ